MVTELLDDGEAIWGLRQPMDDRMKPVVLGHDNTERASLAEPVESGSVRVHWGLLDKNLKTVPIVRTNALAPVLRTHGVKEV